MAALFALDDSGCPYCCWYRRGGVKGVRGHGGYLQVLPVTFCSISSLAMDSSWSLEEFEHPC